MLYPHNIKNISPFVLEDDNVEEDSEYFYLTQLAAKCTAKRLVPDYISEKKMKELKEGNCFPVMGCRSCLSPWKDENGRAGADAGSHVKAACCVGNGLMRIAVRQ